MLEEKIAKSKIDENLLNKITTKISKALFDNLKAKNSNFKISSPHFIFKDNFIRVDYELGSFMENFDEENNIREIKFFNSENYFDDDNKFIDEKEFEDNVLKPALNKAKKVAKGLGANIFLIPTLHNYLSYWLLDYCAQIRIPYDVVEKKDIDEEKMKKCLKEDRQDSINILKNLGLFYNFEKYSDQALYSIAMKAKSKANKENNRDSNKYKSIIDLKQKLDPKCPICGKHLNDAGECPQCDLGDNDYEIDEGLFEDDSNKTPKEYNNKEELLTPEQIKFFKNSKIRDEDGNLIICYHGTKNPGFKEFDPSRNKSQFGKYKFGNYNINYFTDDKTRAIGYTDIGIEEGGNVYACYLNIVNPYIVDNQTEAEVRSAFNIKDSNIRKKEIDNFKKFWNKWSNKILDENDVDNINKDLFYLNCELKPSSERKDNANYSKDENYYDLYRLGNNSYYGAEHIIMYAYELNELFDNDMYEEVRDNIVGDDENYPNDYLYSIDDLIRFVILMNEEDNTNYDGIIVSGIIDNRPTGSLFGGRATNYITLKSSNQIKSISNKNPSNSNKIDGETNKLDDKDTLIIDDDNISEYINKYVKPKTTEEILDIINKPFKLSYKIYDEFPMFLLPNGQILTETYDTAIVHEMICKDICNAIFEQEFKDRDIEFDYTYCGDWMGYVTDNLEWVRLNCGTSSVEWSFYCVIPPKNSVQMTSSQYSTLKDFLDEGLILGKDKVLIYCGDNSEASNTYNLNEYSSEDIIAKIKRYYTTGILYEESEPNKEQTNKPLNETTANDKLVKLVEECVDNLNNNGFEVDLDNIKIEETSSTREYGSIELDKDSYADVVMDGRPVKYILKLSKYLTNEPDEIIKNTIYHELCHYLQFEYLFNNGIWEIYADDNFNYILRGSREYYNNESYYKGHGGLWKEIADKVGKITNQDIKRTNSYTDHTEVGKARAEKINYIVKCKNCGNSCRYSSKTQFVKNPNMSVLDDYINKYGKQKVYNKYNNSEIEAMNNRGKWRCGKCGKAFIWEVEEVN